MAYVPFKLSAEQKKRLIALEEDMRAIELELKRGERAGIDMSELKKRYEEGKKLRDGILREYA